MKHSLLSDDKVCYLCKTPNDIHKHHIFFGSGRRALSELDGCWCYLCARHHNMSDKSVHFDRDLDLWLKKICQKKWEEKKGTHNDFIHRYGRSYL